jgi:hypothetical protein
MNGEQQENLERVTSCIERAIVEFCRRYRRFHADQLHEWVSNTTGLSAPASSDRILRSLRQRGIIDYRILNRRRSLYEVLSVKGTENGIPGESRE